MNQERQSGRMRPAFLTGALVLTLSAIGFALRIYNVGNQSIWADEIYTMQYAKMSFAEILRFHFGTFDPHAPLFYFVEKLWVPLAGENELSFRYPTIFFGALLIPAMYVLGKIAAGRAIGLLSALLLVANPFHVYYAQEARTYALSVLLTALSTALFIKIVTKRASSATWIAYVAVTTLSVYSHYFAFLIILAQNLGFLLLWRQRQLNLRHWLLAQALFVVPYLPWAGFAARLLIVHRAEFAPKPIWEIFPSFATNFTVGWFLPADQTRWLPVFLGFVFVLAFVSLARLKTASETADHLTSAQTLAISIISYVVPVALVYLFFLATGRYFVQERYLIITTPFLYIILAIGLFQLRRLTFALPALLVVGLMGLQAASLVNLYTLDNFAKPDHRNLARYVEGSQRWGDGIVAMGDVLTSVFSYYYNSRYAGNLGVIDLRDREPEENIPRILESAMRARLRVWFLPYADRPNDVLAEDWLNSHAFKMENRWFKTGRVTLYSTIMDPPEVTQQMGARFADEVELTSYSLTSTRSEPGDAVQLRLFWKALQDGKRDLKVSVRLIDEEGHVVNQLDRRPGDDTYITLRWKQGDSIADNLGIMVPLGSPPGRYGVEVGLYDRDTGRHLSTVATAERGSLVTLPLQSVVVTDSSREPKIGAFRFGQWVDADFGSAIRLVGFDRLRAAGRPGDRLPVAVYWQALQTLGRDLGVLVRFVGRGAPDGAEARDAIGPARFGTSQWQSGRIVRDFLDIELPKRLQAGTYDLVLAVTDGETELRPALPEPFVLGTVEVKSRQRSFEAPKPERPYSEAFGEVAEFLGYDLAPVGRSQPARLTLYWRSRKETDTSYKVFVHFLDSKEKVVAQSDSPPASGVAPTTSWISGEVITDRHEVVMPDGLPAGTYVVEVGLYDATTGVRLKRSNGEDRILLGEVAWP